MSPVVAGDIAGQNLDHRRFAGAVLADQRVNFARARPPARPLKGRNAGERLADSPHRKQGAAIRRESRRVVFSHFSRIVHLQTIPWSAQADALNSSVQEAGPTSECETGHLRGID